MRVVTSRHVDLARALSKEAQGAGRDSEIHVPPTIQPVIELPSQLKRLDTPAQDIEVSDSFAVQFDVRQLGASGGVTTNGPRLVSGLWRIKGHVRGQFTGTSNVNNDSFIRLQQQNSAGSVDFHLGRLVHLTGQALVFPVDLLLSLTNAEGNTYSLDIATSATIAGDLLAFGCSLILDRML